MNFAALPQQSQILQQQNLIPPLPLSDAEAIGQDQDVKRARLLESRKYKKLLECHFRFGNATNEDMLNAISFNFATKLGANLPAIQRTLAPIAAADVAEALAPILDARFNELIAQMNARLNAQSIQMNAQYDQMIRRQRNTFVTQLDHEILPILPIPQFEMNGNPLAVPDLPDNYPATKLELLELSQETIAPILEIYQLPNEGTLEKKIANLGIFLGLPPL
mmetsp:Transcript_28069/g.39980  ORF Transcript_28069/g.39980 Transcript_28069/m.39980 type:complete len:221 (+) Transcript_28069:43-705(+)